jgi:hypothetical protein
MKLLKILFVTACFINTSLAQNYLQNMTGFTAIDKRTDKLYDSVRVKIDDRKIRSLIIFSQNRQYHVTYSYNDKGLLSAVEKDNNLYHIRYDGSGRLVSLKDHNTQTGKTITHQYACQDSRIEESVTGGNFPYSTTFYMDGKDIVRVLITRPESIPPPMRDEIAYELAYRNGNLESVRKTKNNKFLNTQSHEYTLTFGYTNRKSLFAQLNKSLFGVHAGTTALLLNTTSFYANSWEPYFIGFDMAGTNNIASMSVDPTGAGTLYFPYAVTYEYNKNKTLKTITKTIDRNGQKEYELYVFSYKK